MNDGTLKHPALPASAAYLLAGGIVAASAGAWIVSLRAMQAMPAAVAGYRIYRAEGDGAWQPIGSTFEHGYVDLTANALAAYRYAVAAYTATGGESPLSAARAAGVGTRPRRVYLPLTLRGGAR
jgi:hypothetical protein